MNINKRVLDYHHKTGRVPDINIVFCGDRVVVSANKKTENGEEHPTGHITIFYHAPFVFYRIGKAIKKCFKDSYKQNEKND